MNDLELDLATTALVLVNLQKGIIRRAVGPRSGEEVVATAARLADVFRQRGVPVVLVRTAVSDLPPLKVDRPILQGAGTEDPRFADLDLTLGEGIVVTTRQWGAFYGTDLDLQLRRRGVRTLVLGGLTTSIAVESTARAAHDYAYEQVFVEDAMAGLDAEMHEFAVRRIFPHLGRVRSSQQVLAALVAAS